MIDFICPHCGYEYSIAQFDNWGLYNDDNSEEMSCPDCKKDFVVEKDVTWKFSARKTDEQELQEDKELSHE